MVATVFFYITMGLIGLFGLALTIASIVSLVRTLRRNHRVKQYTDEQRYTKTLPKEKHYVQENTKYIANNGRPVVITQSGYDDQRVTIGYVPNGSTLRVSQLVQANTGNKAEKQKRQIKNYNKVLSKCSRNNRHESKQGKFVPKHKIKNFNGRSKYSKYNYKFVFRAK